ncbi:hypothetical protein KRP22_012884 [Phytophthora ramorum]|nr:Major facilitator superfamily domain-containing protein 6 [Phytophthora ramorum]
MGCRLMFLLDAGEAKELIPLKMLFVTHYYCNSLIAYLSIFYQEQGVSTSKIGILLAIPSLATGVSGGFIDGYLFLNVYDLSDDGATIVSVFVAVETLSEIPIFFLSSSMIKRFGTAVCLFIVVVALLVRAIVYAYMEQPWYVVPLEMLHGITFGLLAATLTTYLYAASPKEAAGTMIGLLSAFQRGIGSGIASLVGGYIYDEYGARTMWKVSGFGIIPASFLLIGIFAWLARRYTQENTDLQEQLVEQADSPTVLNKSSPLQ